MTRKRLRNSALHRSNEMTDAPKHEVMLPDSAGTVSSHIRYRCSVCQSMYETQGAAEACAAQGIRGMDTGHALEVGDVVVGYPRYGWFDGDPKWVVNPDKGHIAQFDELANKFKGSQMHSFYYVVTHIGLDPGSFNRAYNGHRLQYWVKTKAMSGTQGYVVGYTTSTHSLMYKPEKEPPKSVLDAAPNMVGWKGETDEKNRRHRLL